MARTLSRFADVTHSPRSYGSRPSQMHRHRKRASATWACQGILLLLVTTLLSTLLLWSRGKGLSKPATTSQDGSLKARKIGMQSVLTSTENKTDPQGEAGPEFSLWSSEDETRRWKACYERKPDWPEPPPQDQSSGYLHVALSGGLNQMRVGLCDAVVVARVLNATLVIPHFDKDSWWDDHSSLEEVFDVDHLIEALQADVRIVKAVPDALASAKIASKLYPRKSTPQFYIEHALPLLKSKGQLELRKFDFRLADRIDEDLQKLRCRVNFYALRFTPALEQIGRQLVSAVSKDRKPFVALHMRFEPDMLAFSGCDYGLGPEAEAELTALRARWKNLPQDMDPDHQRRHGHCVLTPEEIGRSLESLGYPSDTLVYIASGPIFGGEESVQPLRERFPNLVTKTTLMTSTELEPLNRSFSKLAALDYIVCAAADAFISNNNGNMARVIAGVRLVAGNMRSIQLAGYDLQRVLDDKALTKTELSRKLRKKVVDKSNLSAEFRTEGSFFQHPVECMCSTI